MRHTNSMVRDWLLNNNYNYIWFKPHQDTRKSKFKETYETKEGVFYQTDIYNLFDGICSSPHGEPVFLQMSTTNWHPEKPYLEFLNKNKGFKILMFKAVKRKSRWHLEHKDLHWQAGTDEMPKMPVTRQYQPDFHVSVQQ